MVSTVTAEVRAECLLVLELILCVVLLFSASYSSGGYQHYVTSAHLPFGTFNFNFNGLPTAVYGQLFQAKIYVDPKQSMMHNRGQPGVRQQCKKPSKRDATLLALPRRHSLTACSCVLRLQVHLISRPQQAVPTHLLTFK